MGGNTPIYPINSVTKHCLDEINLSFSQFKELNLQEESYIKGTLNSLYKLGKMTNTSLIEASTIVNYLKFVNCPTYMINKIQAWLFELNKRRTLTGYNVDYSTEQSLDDLIEKLKSKELNFTIIEY